MGNIKLILYSGGRGQVIRSCTRRGRVTRSQGGRGYRIERMGSMLLISIHPHSLLFSTQFFKISPSTIFIIELEQLEFFETLIFSFDFFLLLKLNYSHIFQRETPKIFILQHPSSIGVEKLNFVISVHDFIEDLFFYNLPLKFMIKSERNCL